MTTIKTEADLDDAITTVRLAAVVGAWSKRGLFDELADSSGHSLDELPGDARALRVTARILANAGLLVRCKSKWELSPSAAQMHEDGVLGGERTLEYVQSLGKLDMLLEQGGPIADDDGDTGGSDIGVYPDDPERTRQFQQMLYRRSARSAKATSRWIDRMLDDEARVLDLGGGHGRYGMELAARGHRVTLFDLPVSVDVAQNMHGDELDYIGGDFFADELGGPYDLVLASNIVHGLSRKKNEQLTQRIADSLAPGGAFVIKDMFLDEFECWPPNAVYFGLTMLMYTEKGDSYSLDEAHRWFEAAGLNPREPVVFESFSLAVGRRSD